MYADGTRYEGGFKLDKRHGTLHRLNRVVHLVGYGSALPDPSTHTFIHPHPIHPHPTTPGKGTLSYPDGSRLVGEFKEDQVNGEGVLHFKNGDTYEGPFKVCSWYGRMPALIDCPSK